MFGLAREPYVCISLQYALLLAKKRGFSAATISQPGGAEVLAITATREVTRPRLPRAKLRFSPFYLVSKHFGRPRSLFPTSASLSFVSQLFNLLVFISFSPSLSFSLPPASSFRNDRDREMIYARSYVFFCVSNLCISTKRKFLHTKAEDVREAKFLRSVYRVQYSYFFIYFLIVFSFIYIFRFFNLYSKGILIYNYKFNLYNSTK